MVKAYCLKEKKHVDVKDPKFVLNARGSPMVRGTCTSCGGKIAGMIKMVDAPKELQDKAKHAKKGSGEKKSRSRKSRKSRKSKKSRSCK